MRHAWLILTHGNFEILEKQLHFLDSEKSDFYIHVDAKADFDERKAREAVRQSQVYFVKRYRISWGHFSIVEAELELLRSAAKRGYDYYHLISGVDLPVKSREAIENYFEEHPGISYAECRNPEITERNMWRVRYHYPFQRLNIRQPRLRRLIRNLTGGIQYILRVDHTRALPESFVFQKGSQWFDITHELTSYLLEHEDEIRRIFNHTYCPDEMFVQTMAVNSPLCRTLEPGFRDSEGHAVRLRYLDWQRGNPYTFRESDFEELIHIKGTPLFARKFDYQSSPALVEKIFSYFGG